MNKDALKTRIRWLLGVVILGLIVSGITAVPLVPEVRFLNQLMGPGTALGAHCPVLAEWVSRVLQGLLATQRDHPFLFYGTDWLAFAHVVIALAFWGPWRDPVRNLWVIEFGLLACVLVVPMALIFGGIRGLPFFWRLIDCSFGVGAFIPLWVCRSYVRRLSQMG